MSESKEVLKINSTRFGELEIPADCVIDFPSGVIGFPRCQKYVLIDHKPPFSWLHSIDDPNLAFVVIDGFEFGKSYEVKPPMRDAECDFREEDEYAILIIVTVRADAMLTTANLKAPIFVNLRNHKAVQIILDDQRYSTRYSLWAKEEDANKEISKLDPSKK